MIKKILQKVVWNLRLIERQSLKLDGDPLKDAWTPHNFFSGTQIQALLKGPGEFTVNEYRRFVAFGF